MSDAKIVVSNTIFQFLGKFFTMSMAILVTGIVTRAYGVEGYGVFSLVVGFPALFYIIADFGLNAIATRELSVKETYINKFIGNILILRIVFSLILIGVSGSVLAFLDYPTEVKIGILVGLLTILTTSLYATSNIGFQVKLRYDLSNLANALGAFVVPVVIGLLIFYKAPISLIGLANVLSGVTTVALCYLFLRKLGVKPQLKVDNTLVKDLLTRSWPLGLMFIFSQLNFKADSIMLSVLNLPKSMALSNIEAVGVYGLAYKVFEVALVVPTFFMNSVYPIMVRHYSVSKQKLVSTFKRVLLFLFIAGVCCGIFGLLFSDLIIYILGGSGFSDSATVLKILLGVIFIFYLTQPLAWLIVTLGGQKYLPGIYIWASAVNLSLNYVFIPRYSFFASANVTWISELVILVLLSLTALKLLKNK